MLILVIKEKSFSMTRNLNSVFASGDPFWDCGISLESLECGEIYVRIINSRLSGLNNGAESELFRNRAWVRLIFFGQRLLSP